ncbi:hypothetical protein [Halobacillus aidingensis]|uniref:Uncharacterized protein n=1 Tax=Halobacillus aidingensis TaxID=240303 RepID=A0A1H0G0W2_HALAD|nr:hypothetical protein [Halobacillus aidingensis]SDO00482.1 hypothetical protein SAMN05421677_102183 [Halobacillus aidingensis]
MNMKSAVLLLFGVLFGLILANMFTHSHFDGSQLLLTVIGGVFGYGIVILFVKKRQGKRN